MNGSVSSKDVRSYVCMHGGASVKRSVSPVGKRFEPKVKPSSKEISGKEISSRSV